MKFPAPFLHTQHTTSADEAAGGVLATVKIITVNCQKLKSEECLELEGGVWKRMSFAVPMVSASPPPMSPEPDDTEDEEDQHGEGTRDTFELGTIFRNGFGLLLAGFFIRHLPGSHQNRGEPSFMS